MWAKVEGASIKELILRPKAMTIGDTQYPHNIFGLWSTSELEAIGIYEVTIDHTNLKDIKYYSNTDITYAFSSGAVTGSYGTATAKTLADLKTLKKSGVNRQANSMETQIDGAANVDALAALYVYNSADPATRPLGEWPSKPE